MPLADGPANAAANAPVVDLTLSGCTGSGVQTQGRRHVRLGGGLCTCDLEVRTPIHWMTLRCPSDRPVKVPTYLLLGVCKVQNVPVTYLGTWVTIPQYLSDYGNDRGYGERTSIDRRWPFSFHCQSITTAQLEDYLLRIVLQS